MNERIEESWYSRTELLIGTDKIAVLKASHIIVFGIGGVGSYALEALARAGVGEITIVDFDKISLSNINRQLLALRSNIGCFKIDVAEERLRQINCDIKIHTLKEFYCDEKSWNFTGFDYIVDAIDCVSSKIALIKNAKNFNVPIISCMGTGNKLNCSALKIDDISRTTVCPLARAVRRELRKEGITRGVKVVYSTEPPVKTLQPAVNNVCSQPQNLWQDMSYELRPPISSISFVPAVAGLLLAGEVIRDLINMP